MKVLRLPQVRERTGLSKMTLNRMEKAGRFPRRVQLGANSIAWAEHEVDDWLRAKLADRDGTAGDV